MMKTRLSKRRRFDLTTITIDTRDHFHWGVSVSVHEPRNSITEVPAMVRVGERDEVKIGNFHFTEI